MSRSRAAAPALVIALTLAALGAGCATGESAAGTTVAVTQRPWAAIAREIAGDRARVVEAGAPAGSDPHLFEPDARTAAALSDADVVVLNGADLDHWAEEIVAGSNRNPRVVTATEVLGTEGDPGGSDPHLWFEPAAGPAVARAVTETLTAADPDGRAAYERGLARFLAQWQPVRDRIAAIRSSARGTPVAVTERVVDRLLRALGLRVVSPSGFAVSVEEGEEPSARDTAAMNALVTGGRARILVYNTEAETPATEQVRTHAADRGLPVVEVTEAMPAAVDSYPDWIGRTVDAIRRALPAAP